MNINFRKMSFMLERINRFKLALSVYSNVSIIVDQNTVNIRSKLCASCHNNMDAAAAKQGCVLSGDEDRKLMNQAAEVIKGINSPHDGHLRFCAIDGCDNRIATRLFLEHLLKKQDQNDYPTFCWKKDHMK